MISAVVVFHSDPLRLRTTVSSLVHQAEEILVVDVSPTGDVATMTFPDHVRILRRPANLGYGWACNEGLAQARGDYVLISNADITYHGEALSRLQAVAATGCLTGPRQVTRAVITPLGQAMQTIQLGVSRQASVNRWLWLGRIRDRRRLDQLVRAASEGAIVLPAHFTLSGAAILAKRCTWQRLGGFDQRFFLYHEDADLCVRARAAGVASTVVWDAVADHESGTSRSGIRGSIVRWSIQSEQDAWRAHGLPVRQLQAIQVLGLLGRGAVAGLRRQPGRAEFWFTIFWEVVHGAAC